MKVSIICPIYNTPIDLVERCITSILSQTYTSYEVLLVDDGSDSSYGRILDFLVSRDERIRVIHTPNGGVSHARNIGIDYSEGEYICFVDGDDSVPHYFLHHAVNLLEINEVDAVYGKIRRIPSGEEATPLVETDDYLTTYKKSGDNKDNLKCAILGTKKNAFHMTIQAGPYAKLFRRSSIEGVYFDEALKFNEDNLFNREVIQKIQSAVVCSEIWYDYYQISSSAINSAYGNPRQYLGMLSNSWGAFAAMDFADTEMTRQASWVDGLEQYTTFLYNGVLRCSESFSVKKRLMDEALESLYINDAIQHLSLNNPFLSNGQKLKLVFVKCPFSHLRYFFFWIWKKIRRW